MGVIAKGEDVTYRGEEVAGKVVTQGHAFVLLTPPVVELSELARQEGCRSNPSKSTGESHKSSVQGSRRPAISPSVLGGRTSVVGVAMSHGDTYSRTYSKGTAASKRTSLEVSETGLAAWSVSDPMTTAALSTVICVKTPLSTAALSNS